MRRALVAALVVPAALAALAASTGAAGRAPARAARARRVHGLIRDVPTGRRIHAPVTAAGAGLAYGGGSVLHSNRSHVIFWQPSGSNLRFDPTYERLIETFLSRVAADSHKTTNVYGLSGQYRDSQGPAAYASTYVGAVVDADPLPSQLHACAEPATGPRWHVCLTDAQLKTEIDHIVTADRLARTGTDVYFLVLPRGFASCVGPGPDNCALGGGATGYCGYHSETAARVLYAVIPYNGVRGHCQSNNPRPNGSPVDPTISTISHEHNEMVTDPYGNAWVNADGTEDGDLCITSFSQSLGGSGSKAYNEVIDGGRYFLQEEWSNETSSCQPRAKRDRVWFATPARRRVHRRLQFTAHANMPDGTITAYRWSFGDGAVGHGRVTDHTFNRPGTFHVALRTTDSADNWAYHSVSVVVG